MATDGKDSTGNSGGGADDSAPQPVRNMDDIAKLFMTGAREAASHRRGAPLATPHSGIPASIPVAPAGHSTGPFCPPLAQLMITSSIGDAGWLAALGAARHLAAEWEAGIGIVGVQGGKMRLLRAGRARPGSVAVARALNAETGPIDLQLARALFGMRENVAYWMIVLPTGAAAEHLLATVRDWLLVSGTDNESVVSAYRVFKNVVAADPLEEPRKTRLFISCEDYAQAAVVHARLRRAAREFLQQELPLQSVNGASPADVQTVAELTVGDQDAAAWSSVAEFLHDLLGDSSSAAEEAEIEAGAPIAASPVAQVVTPLSDPDEALIAQPPMPAIAEPPPLVLPSPLPEAVAEAAAAPILTPLPEPTQPLGNQWNQQWSPETGPREPATSRIAPPESAPIKPAPIRTAPQPAPSQNAAPQSAPLQTVPAQSAPPQSAPVAMPGSTAFPASAAGALRAVELNSVTDETRWNAVVASAADLCAGEQIEARPPGFARSAIWLDRTGVLHVWVLADTGGNWLELWHWAREHRQILALTRRDRWVDTAADVRIHVVAHAEARLRPAKIPGVSWYRLTLVRLADKTAAVVIPAE